MGTSYLPVGFRCLVDRKVYIFEYYLNDFFVTYVKIYVWYLIYVYIYQK